MLEAAEIGQKLDQETFARLEVELRTQLVQMQVKLREGGFPVLVVVSGDDPAGCRGVVNMLSEWMDPRFIATHVFGEATEEERLRPMAWRYWQALPPKGRIGVYANDWVTHGLALRLRKKLKMRAWEEGMEATRRFEKMLVDDGAVIIKVYLHVSGERREEQKKRLKEEGNDVASIGREMRRQEKRTRRMVEETLAQSSIPGSMWTLVESDCPRFRDVTVAKLLLEMIGGRLASKGREEETKEVGGSGGKTILEKIDLTQKLLPEEYEKRMEGARVKLRKLVAKAKRQGVAVVAAFEGWDAAGKGGAIRRLAHTMNPESYQIVPIAAPTEEEKAYHYLWRFWRHIPREGQFVIFDRTWYGRVLVERVEGFCPVSAWQRAYEEINYFERELCRSGIVLVKFWLHIDKEEQLRRFKDREDTPFKQFKIGPEDYRNREKWEQYAKAVNEMVARTSTAEAPWHIIPSDDKLLARARVLETVAEALEKVL